MGFCNASRSHGFCSTSKRWYKGINISAKTTRHTTHVASQRAHGVSYKESSVLHSGWRDRISVEGVANSHRRLSRLHWTRWLPSRVSLGSYLSIFPRHWCSLQDTRQHHETLSPVLLEHWESWKQSKHFGTWKHIRGVQPEVEFFVHHTEKQQAGREPASPVLETFSFTPKFQFFLRGNYKGLVERCSATPSSSIVNVRQFLSENLMQLFHKWTWGFAAAMTPGEILFWSSNHDHMTPLKGICMICGRGLCSRISL